MANSVDPDQTAPIGAVCSGSTLFPSIPNWSVNLGNYLQQATSADGIFRCIFFLGALRVKEYVFILAYALCFISVLSNCPEDGDHWSGWWSYDGVSGTL